MNVIDLARSAPICSLALYGYGYPMRGQIIGESEDLVAFLNVDPSGVIGSISPILRDELREVILSSPKLEALAKVVDFGDVKEVGPSSLLEDWIRERRIVSLVIRGDDDVWRAVIEELDDDWIMWSSISEQGVDLGRRVTRRSEFQIIEGDGDLERRIERNVGLVQLDEDLRLES